MSEGVKCEDCNQLPIINKRCGDNGSTMNGCEYILTCQCGEKSQEWFKSEIIAIEQWENKGYKSSKSTTK